LTQLQVLWVISDMSLLLPVASQAACLQVAQVQSLQTQLAQLSVQSAQAQAAWLQVAQVHVAQLQAAHESVQSLHAQVAHSS